MTAPGHASPLGTVTGLTGWANILRRPARRGMSGLGKRCRKISPTVLRPAGALRRCRCSLTEQLSWAAVRVYCKGDCGLLLRRNAQALVDSDCVPCAGRARVRRRLHRERRRLVQARERREGEKRKGIFSICFVSLCNKPIIAAHSLLPFPH